MPLPDVVRRSARKLEEAQLHSYCSQAWNHNFMWHTMTPIKMEPSAFMMDAFRVHFNGFHKFKQRVRSCELVACLALLTLLKLTQIGRFVALFLVCMFIS